jgi:hypothetical protein
MQFHFEFAPKVFYAVFAPLSQQKLSFCGGK